MQLELVVNLNLNASHSLEERESPHPHRWEIQVGLRGALKQGRVVSLTWAQEKLGLALKPLQETFLNNNNNLDSETRSNPTCENLAMFLWERFQSEISNWDLPEVPTLSFVQVGLWEQAEQLGYARISS